MKCSTEESEETRTRDRQTAGAKQLTVNKAAPRLRRGALPLIVLSLLLLSLLAVGPAQAWVALREMWRQPLPQPPEAYPLVYEPAGAEDSHQGIRLKVAEVTHAESETMVQMTLAWADPSWEHHVGPGSTALPFLRDGDGNRYNLTSHTRMAAEVERWAEPAAESAGSAPSNRWMGTRTFAPVPPSARELTLVVQDIAFEVPAGGGFIVDLGDAPRVGYPIPLDLTLVVAGFPVHITGAELLQEEIDTGVEVRMQTVLHFEVAPVAERAHRRLLGIALAAPEAGFSGSRSGYTPAPNRLTMHLMLAEGAALPTGPVEVDIRSAEIAIEGPWQVAWPIPRH